MSNFVGFLCIFCAKTLANIGISFQSCSECDIFVFFLFFQIFLMNFVDFPSGAGDSGGELIQTGPYRHLLNMDFASAVGLDCEPGL